MHFIERMMGKMKCKEVKYSSLTSIYLAARGFQKNYEELKEKLVQSVGQIQYANLMPVAATNGFFAVELYLKTIYAEVYWEKNEKAKETPCNLTKFPIGHDLGKLFDNIDDNSKKGIVDGFPGDIDKVELLKRLEKVRDGFVEWRYFFEKDYLDGNFFFLSNILETLYLFCGNYMESNHNPKDEWLKDTPHISATIHQEQVHSEDEIKKIMNLSLSEVVYKD